MTVDYLNLFTHYVGFKYNLVEMWKTQRHPQKHDIFSLPLVVPFFSNKSFVNCTVARGTFYHKAKAKSAISNKTVNGKAFIFAGLA